MLITKVDSDNNNYSIKTTQTKHVQHIQYGIEREKTIWIQILIYMYEDTTEERASLKTKTSIG